MPQSLQVLILAAGKGARFKSDTPKVLHRLCGVSLLEHVLRAVAGLKPQQISVVVGHGEEAVRKEIARVEQNPLLEGVRITAVRQAEQLGTGHAVQIALPALDPTADILVLPGDSPFVRTERLAEFHRVFVSGNYNVGFLAGTPPSPAGYGRVVRDAKGMVQKIVEERDCSPEQVAIRETNTSIYLLKPTFLKDALPKLDRKNAQNEFYLTDVIGLEAAQGKQVLAHSIADFMEVAGANSRSELSALESYRRRQIAESFMANGVTFEDPERAYIDEDVRLGVDCFIGADVRLRESTTIGANVRIDGDSLISASQIGAGSHLKLGCVIESSTVGEKCSIGPFAHLRPGTFLHEGVKIGNFVETKQAELMQGAKANHLSYIGDATVGANTNIGAGTITCNYDGYEKHRTVLSEGVFVGSNTALVAPVSVGAGAVIGAGSTITKDVPAGALAIERNNQLHVEGWAGRRAAKQSLKKKGAKS